ncbi:phospholipid scramblase-related protein [Nocardiopsis sp. NPDC006938]|uniref:LURP-one-related/scramblase family protein n=1 Tax=Nocardiopsis sp. NPDC006938 TaxID=3364337 RepID=UPI003698CE32
MHAPLFTAPVLLVEQPRRLFSAEGHYEVLSEHGQPLAYVNEHMTAWTHSHRRSSQLPHRFTIYAPDGHPLLSLDKPWDRGRPYIHVSGPHNEPYGSIVQDRSFMGSRFRLNDPRGHTVAEIRGDWSGWDFTVLDHAGIEIARIGKEHPGLGGQFFTTEDRYALEFAYDLPWPLRRLVIGAAITIDVLLHEREPEFYHSHYADFRRYPEYGYEPRHHWHHPRRGYVVSRRQRPPLVVHTFRPVRRRSTAPRDRVGGSRGSYRPLSSRSEAPAPRATRTPRVERRGGGGFASRSEAPSSGSTSRRERQGRSQSGGTSRAAGSRRDSSQNRTARPARDGTTGSPGAASSGLPMASGRPPAKGASTSRGASAARGTSSRGSASSSRGTSSSRRSSSGGFSSRSDSGRNGSGSASGGFRSSGGSASGRSSSGRSSASGRSSSSRSSSSGRSSSSRSSGSGRSGGSRRSGGGSSRRR